jgi:type III pantothenate kinase
MILAIDIGNSHIVVGCIDGDEIVNTSRMSTDCHKTCDEYTVLLRGILDLSSVDCRAFDGAVLSSVVPPLTNIFREVIQKITGQVPIIVGAGIKTGMNILLDNPGQMGSDLVVGGVAVIDAYPLPAIIFDMGTATTISVIDNKANFLGGAIVPGLAISMGALEDGTSLLQRVTLEAPKKCISSNTIDCMKSGAIFGTASMVDGMIDRIEEELGQTCTVIATGGIAGQVIPYCKHEIIRDDQLLFKGMNVIYRKNRKGKVPGFSRCRGMKTENSV